MRRRSRKWSLAAGAALASGCASPADFRVETPAICWPRATLPLDDLRVIQRHLVPPGHTADGLASVLAMLLPPDAASLTGKGGAIDACASTAVQRRIERLVAAVTREPARPVRFVVQAHETSWSFVARLGPLQQARGAGDSCPFLKCVVAPTTPTELDRLADRGEARRLFQATLLVPTGRLTQVAALGQLAYVAGIDFPWETRTGVAIQPRVDTDLFGFRASLAAIALAPDETSGEAATVLALHADDREPLPSRTARCVAAGGNTDLAIALPGHIHRHAEDSAMLRHGESLVLIGTGEEPDTARVVTVTPLVVALAGS